MTGSASIYEPIDEEIVGAWLGSLDLVSGTKTTYSCGLKAFCGFVSRTGLDLDSLTREDVLEFKRYLIAERKLAPATVSNYLAAVRSFYLFSEGRGIENVARGVKGEASSRDFKKDALTPDQARKMLDRIDRSAEGGMRDFALLNLLLRTGLRDVEVVRADVGDLRQTSGVDVLMIRGKGKSEKDSFVVLTSEALEPIEKYLEFRADVGPRDPLFASVARRNKGGRLTTRSVSRIAKQAMRATGIDDERHSAHSLRHTAVTLSLLGGATEREAQDMARHADISTTMIYSHHIDRIKNAAELKIGNVLDL